jgi:4,5-dihydroxyphthalate decarboxylase
MSAMASGARVKLFTLLGDYPHTRALKSGAVASDLIEFAFADIAPANRGFKPLVREHRFDLSEVAIVTFLQAKAQGTPYALLPLTMMSRGQLHTIAYDPARGPLAPQDLPGRRVGVRAYSQTTGVWLRGMMQDLYGIDPTSIRWVTFEDAHVAGYTDPPWVERAPPGKELVPMLLAGELDAAIVGDTFPDPRLKPLIPDAEAQNLAFARAHGGVPINHMLVIREEFSGRADLIGELTRLLRASKEAAKLKPAAAGLDPLRFGIAPRRRSLETIIDYAARQELIPRRFTVDELFADVMRLSL